MTDTELSAAIRANLTPGFRMQMPDLFSRIDAPDEQISRAITQGIFDGWLDAADHWVWLFDRPATKRVPPHLPPIIVLPSHMEDQRVTFGQYGYLAVVDDGCTAVRLLSPEAPSENSRLLRAALRFVAEQPAEAVARFATLVTEEIERDSK